MFIGTHYRRPCLHTQVAQNMGVDDVFIGCFMFGGFGLTKDNLWRLRRCRMSCATSTAGSASCSICIALPKLLSTENSLRDGEFSELVWMARKVAEFHLLVRQKLEFRRYIILSSCSVFQRKCRLCDDRELYTVVQWTRVSPVYPFHFHRIDKLTRTDQGGTVWSLVQSAICSHPKDLFPVVIDSSEPVHFRSHYQDFVR